MGKSAEKKVAVIGAGVGGLATAIRLRLQGHEVAVYEANAGPGGKLTEIRMDGYRFDAGPSLFTLPHLVDELFREAGLEPAEYFQYEALPLISRYFYEDGTQINAWSDPEKFAEEVEAKTGEPRERVLQLLKKSRGLYDITAHVFLERSLHRIGTYLRRDTLWSITQLHRLDAFRTMNQANAQRFSDPRVVQLFNRYATYNGSDPYQAPATLNIIPHLEHNLGAFFPHGGMYEVTRSLAQLAGKLGVQFHYSHDVSRILVNNKKACGLIVNNREIAADVVVSNMDVVPTFRRLMPEVAAPEKILEQPRSSSALIFYWGMDRSYEALDLHNLLFSADYQEECRYLWEDDSIGPDPTVYVYISSKNNPADAPAGGENWFVMINVPPDKGQDWESLIAAARENILDKLERMLGEPVRAHICCESLLEPHLLASRTSSHMGALYGNSSNNRFAAFLRHPNFSRRIDNLYFCGGSVHPGGGVPLCLLSAKITAELVGQA